MAVLVQVCAAILWAAVVDGGRMAGWLMTVHVCVGFDAVVVGMIVNIGGGPLCHHAAILHYGSYTCKENRKIVRYFLLIHS